MGSTVGPRKIAFFLFLTIVRVSRSHSAGNFNDLRHYERNNVQASPSLTTPLSKLSDDDLYDSVGANYFDGLDEHYLTSSRQNENGVEDGQSWSTKAKRRWAENSMSVWGKRNNAGQATRSAPSLRRMWSENSMAVWGKRLNKPQLKEAVELMSSAQIRQRQQPNNIRYDDFNVNRPEVSEQNSDLFNHQPAHKRRWAENSMSVWGKRVSSKNLLDDPSVQEDDSTLQAATRDLAANSYSINSHPDQEKLLKILHRKHWEPKRNWATNTMNVWGKRDKQEDKTSITADYIDIMPDRSTDDV